MTPFAIMLADDHVILRQGLSASGVGKSVVRQDAIMRIEIAQK